ncbi:MAG: D-aminoacylase [Planctomycetota bacterium]
MSGLLWCAWLLAAPIADGTESGFDVLLRGGRVVDGSGNPWFHADVAISHGEIVAVGNLAAAKATTILDVTGLTIAPGFIDMMGQSALTILVDPRGESKLRQGVTTEVQGEGFSPAPMSDYWRADNKDFLEHFKLTADWNNLDQYFKRIDQLKPGFNIATTVGHTTVRTTVLGGASRPPTSAELDAMKKLVAEAMVDGALGLGSAIEYAPGSYSATDELIELAKVAAQYGGVYTTHMRSEALYAAGAAGVSIFDALDEALRIGREAHLPVEIHHLKAAGEQTFGKMPELVKRIDAARASGLDVTANVYPYLAGATSLSACVPKWAHEGGLEKLLEHLRDGALRARIKDGILSGEGKGAFFGAGAADRVLIASVQNSALKKYQGRKLSAIAAELSRDPADVVIELLLQDRAQTGMTVFLMREDDMRLALAQPWVQFCTDYNAEALDGPLYEGQLAHPRAFGTYPRILGQYVREAKLLTLEEAVRKSTFAAAQRVGLHDRGLLRQGFAADVVVFDAAKILDAATFEQPGVFPDGVVHVLVNGVLAVRDGKLTGERGGRALRGPAWKKG